MTPNTMPNPDALAAIVAKAKQRLPDSHNRIEKAVDLVRHNAVTVLPDGSVLVASQAKSEISYTVNGSCSCADFMSAPLHLCKHKLAVTIVKRLQEQEQTTSEDTSEDKPPRIPPQFVTQLHGKDFVQYSGLLAMAHERGLVNLSAHFISVTEGLALAEATAEFQDGRTFMECADATPTNVNPKVKAHFARMALTRAKARALRDALNIAMCSVEEIAE